MLLELLVGIVDAQLLEVVLVEDLEAEDVQHADELVRVLSLGHHVRRGMEQIENTVFLNQHDKTSQSFRSLE